MNQQSFNAFISKNLNKLVESADKQSDKKFTFYIKSAYMEFFFPDAVSCPFL
jgi:hypothetical protein